MDDYRVLEGRGTIVPYGNEETTTESEVVNQGGGGGSDLEQDEAYLCWYYRYPDGSRSAYFLCERIR